MKKRRVDAKMITRKIFIDVYESDRAPDHQNIIVFDTKSRRFETHAIKFYNWMYITNCEIVEGMNGIKSVYPVGEKNVLWHSQTNNVYKVFYNNEFPMWLVDSGLKSSQRFETRIPKSVRFITHFKLNFLDYVKIDRDGVCVIDSSEFQTEFPTIVLVINKQKFYFRITDDGDLVTGAEQKDDESCLFFRFDRNDPIDRDRVLNYFEDMFVEKFFKRFVSVGKTNNVNKMPLSPKDLFEVMHLKNCDKIKLLFVKYFKMTLFVSASSPVSFKTLMFGSNKKIVMDSYYLAMRKSDSICRDIEPKQSFSSNSLISVTDLAGGNSLFVTCDDNELIVELDFDSMYPSNLGFVLCNEAPPILAYSNRLLDLKRGESDPVLRNVIKIMLNMIYGHLGISGVDYQGIVPSNPKISAGVALAAKNLLMTAIQQIGKEALGGEFICCHTDSFVVKTKCSLSNIKQVLARYNEKMKNGGLQIRLKVETVGTKLLVLNKNSMVWYNQGSVKCKGLFFDSSMCPKIIRDRVKGVILEVIGAVGVNSIEVMLPLLEKASKRVYEELEGYRIENIDEILTSRANKGRVELGITMVSHNQKIIQVSIMNAVHLFGDTVLLHEFMIKDMFRCYFNQFVGAIRTM
jgi:hypothetical protein